MSTFTLAPTAVPPGRHRVPAPPTTSMSATTWGHVRAALTATVVVAATLTGITVGLGGAAVSPVAVTTPAAAPTGPVAVDDGPGAADAGHSGHHHR